MCENQILQMLTLLNLPSLILAKIENFLTWKIYTCKNHQISIFAWLHLQNNLWILSKFKFPFSPYLIPVKYFKNWVYLQKLLLPNVFVKINSLSYYFVITFFLIIDMVDIFIIDTNFKIYRTVTLKDLSILEIWLYVFPEPWFKTT